MSHFIHKKSFSVFNHQFCQFHGNKQESLRGIYPSKYKLEVMLKTSLRFYFFYEFKLIGSYIGFIDKILLKNNVYVTLM